MHRAHSKYKSTRVYHEAGYDSLLTAQVFIKLSARLREGGVSRQPAPKEGSPEKRSPARRNRKVTRRMSGLRVGFNVLDVEDLEDSTDEEAEEGDKKRLRADEEEDEDNNDDDAESKARRGALIPRHGTEFWEVYGNKLRTFGTEERLCDLTRATSKNGANGSVNGSLLESTTTNNAFLL